MQSAVGQAVSTPVVSTAVVTVVSTAVVSTPVAVGQAVSTAVQGHASPCVTGYCTEGVQ